MNAVTAIKAKALFCQIIFITLETITHSFVNGSALFIVDGSNTPNNGQPTHHVGLETQCIYSEALMSMPSSLVHIGSRRYPVLLLLPYQPCFP
jgi:hypothetical protein